MSHKTIFNDLPGGNAAHSTSKKKEVNSPIKYKIVENSTEINEQKKKI